MGRHAMAVVEHKGAVPLPDDPREDCTIQVRMAFPDRDVDVAELRAQARAVLERYIDGLGDEQWRRHTTIVSRDHRPERGATGPYHIPSERRPPRPKLKARDDVDLPRSTLKACHRLVDSVFLLSAHGKVVTTGDVLKSRKIAPRTLYKLIDPGSEAWKYLDPYLHVYESGSKRLLDLTEEGRVLASQIRAGATPS